MSIFNVTIVHQKPRPRRMVRAEVKMAPGWRDGLSAKEIGEIELLGREAEMVEMCCDNWPAVQTIVVKFSRYYSSVDVGVALVDRDGYGEVPITFSISFHPDLVVQSNLGMAAVIRDALRRYAEHELDESLYVGGARLWDPHQ